MNNMNFQMILGDKGMDVLTIDSSNKLSGAIAVLENRSEEYWLQQTLKNLWQVLFPKEMLCVLCPIMEPKPLKDQ